jgi:hypothetical protein
MMKVQTGKFSRGCFRKNNIISGATPKTLILLFRTELLMGKSCHGCFRMKASQEQHQKH